MAVSAVFMFCYGSLRFITEFFRTPDSHLGFIAFDLLTMGQLLSLPMIPFMVLAEEVKPLQCRGPRVAVVVVPVQ